MPSATSKCAFAAHYRRPQCDMKSLKREGTPTSRRTGK